MDFENYRFFYLNLILCLLLLFNQFYLFCLFFLFKLPYLLNLETEIEYEFDYDYIDYEDNDTSYLETDIDDEHLYTWIYQEFYVLSGCDFQFEIFGGYSTLDYIDFLDFIIYNINDNRNYKYVYNDIILYQKYKMDNYNSKLSITKDAYINNNYNIKYINRYLDDELNELKSSRGSSKEGLKNKEKLKIKLFNFMANHELYQSNINKIKKVIKYKYEKGI